MFEFRKQIVSRKRRIIYHICIIQFGYVFAYYGSKTFTNM